MHNFYPKYSSMYWLCKPVILSHNAIAESPEYISLTNQSLLRILLSVIIRPVAPKVCVATNK